MKRTKNATIVIFLSVLVASLSLSTPAQGTHISVNWGTPCTVADQDERDAMSHTCSYISDLIDGRANWASQNFYDGSTTSTNVYNTSDSVRNNANYDFLATFHVGDMYREQRSGTWHYNYYDSSGDANGIEDSDLYPHTGIKHYFTYIWTCVNGGLFTNPFTSQLCYGYTDTQNNSGIVGMPYAWTRITGMNHVGYTSISGTYTYIGFENVSKQLKDNSEFVNYNYGDFIRRFYYHAIVDHQTISAALDSAMDDMGTWRDSWGISELNTGYTVWAFGIEWQCRMRIYGNGNMVLPS